MTNRTNRYGGGMAQIRVAVIGGGPQGLSVVERMVANLSELAAQPSLEITIVEPFEVGSGRVWRAEQSALMRMNSYARDVTLFCDESVQSAGPARPGPSLIEWASEVVRGKWRVADPEIALELSELEPTTFPSRRLPSAYLHWFLERVVSDAPSNVKVTLTKGRVESLIETTRGTQRLSLKGGRTVEADLVVLALGNLDTKLHGEWARLATFAKEHSLTYVPPCFTIDADLSVLEAGAPVLCRGFGLAFIDALSLLTEGRGGRFVRDTDGLRYIASGNEPVLFVGSRRGVPYRIKPYQPLRGAALQPPRYLSTAAVDELVKQGRRIDFETQVWPLILKDLGLAYYRELITGYPDRSAISWDEFQSLWDGFDTSQLPALVNRAIPNETDRLNFDRVRRPLGGIAPQSVEELQAPIRQHLAEQLSRVRSSDSSPDTALYFTLLSLFGQLERLRAAVGGRSKIQDIDGRWMSLFHSFVSGPPDFRIEELIALSHAGIVKFVGAEMDVFTCATRRRFGAKGASLIGSLETETLFETKLPDPSVALTADTMLAALHAAGDAAEEVVSDPAYGFTHSTGRLEVDSVGRLLDSARKPHPSRFALGWFTSFGGPRAFAIPHTNAQSLRNSDTVARAVLRRALEIGRHEDPSHNAMELQRC